DPIRSSPPRGGGALGGATHRAQTRGSRASPPLRGIAALNMKPLTTPQYRELVELSRPGYPDMDPSSEPVCQELRREGFAVITRTEEDGDDEIEFWDITERGRL